jgi:3-oxoacyl-[acyl-carrier-protein] synthase II
MSRIAITGIGVVTSIGTGKQAFWDAVLAGRRGFSQVESFDTSAYRVSIGGEVKDFDPAQHVKRLDPTGIGRASQFAIGAAHLALDDAGIVPGDFDPTRSGVSMGTTSGEPNQIERFNDALVEGQLERIGPEFMSLYPCNLIAGYVASELDFAGVNMMIPAACAAGTYAVSHALDTLRAGQADVMLAGGSDAFSRITYTGFARLLAIAPEVCQPFDKNRKGMIPGEGAGMVVLEPLERALARGATVYAEVAGFGLSCDAHHMTGGHPDARGAVAAMRNALADSDTAPEQVSYISAHGTGTRSNDLHETTAVKHVFGAAAHQVPISSVKSMLGHTMGAASAIETAVCALATHHDQIPPTMNLEEADPDCDLDYVPNQARQHRVEVAMNNAYAFGGTNASLILKKCEG